MRCFRLSSLLALPIVAACGGGAGVTEAPSPRAATAAAIAPADLRTRISIFADDSMAGRRTGSPGNVKGNAYIAAELGRLGLRPAGDAGSFLQKVPLTRYAVAPGAGVLRAGAAELKPWKDYFPYQTVFEIPARPVDGAQIVYIGGPADTAALPAREALQGKVVLFRSDADGNSSIAAPDMSPQGRLGLVSGLMITRIDPLIATFEQSLQAPHLTLPSDLQVPPGVTQPRMLFLPTGTVPQIFGKDLSQLHPGDVGPTIAGEVTFEAAPLEATNVVAVLDGADPALRGEYVALGAHNDAIGIVEPVDHDSIRAYNTVVRPRGGNDEPRAPTAEEAERIRAMVDSMRKLKPAKLDSIVNGADDDGSGSMGLLEIAELLSRAPAKPKRSVLFVWHTGEESGLQGSRWFTDHPTVSRDSIVGQINMDMISRGGPESERTRDPAYIQVIGSRRLSTELGDLAEAVNRDGNHGLRFDYSYDADGHPDNFYCRSDHAMYARYGIPVSFFSTGGHRDYHQVTDEIEYQDFDKYARVVQFAADLVQRVANLDHRLVVDKPKPDPAAPCKQ